LADPHSNPPVGSFHFTVSTICTSEWKANQAEKNGTPSKTHARWHECCASRCLSRFPGITSCFLAIAAAFLELSEVFLWFRLFVAYQKLVGQLAGVECGGNPCVFAHATT
jgi:hypothetical protein